MIFIGGQSALALRLLLAVFSSKLSSVADRPFGDEVLNLEDHQDSRFVLWTVLDQTSPLQFRAARKASEEVGAQLVLGDRPIEITVMCL